MSSGNKLDDVMGVIRTFVCNTDPMIRGRHSVRETCHHFIRHPMRVKELCGGKRNKWHVPEDQVELAFSHAEGRDLFNELKEIQRRSDNYGLLLLIFSKANPILFNELKNARVI